MGNCCEYYKNDVNDTCSKICNNKLLFIEDMCHILNDPKYDKKTNNDNNDNVNKNDNTNKSDELIIELK